MGGGEGRGWREGVGGGEGKGWREGVEGGKEGGDGERRWKKGGKEGGLQRGGEDDLREDFSSHYEECFVALAGKFCELASHVIQVCMAECTLF